MQTFSMKRGDTSPALRYLLGGPEVNLVGASVVFNMANMLTRASKIARAPAAVEAGDAPIVSYTWEAGDTAEAGNYLAEFEVTYADGAIETFPNADALVVVIGPDLG